MTSRALAALAALALLAPRAHAAAADPSLIPEMDSLPRRKAEKKAPPPPGPAVPEPEAQGALPFQPDEYNPARPPRRRIFKEEAPPRRPWLITRARAWLTSGEVSTRYAVQIPPADVHPPGVVFEGETQEHRGRGTMPVYSAEVAPLTFLSFEGQYGDGKMRGGYVDRYWIHAPDMFLLTYTPTGATWHNPNHEDDLVLGAESTVEREWEAATMYARVIDARINAPEALDLRHSLDVALGADRYRQLSRDTDLRVTSNQKKFYSGLDPGTPFPGFDSTYEAEWIAPHVGLREEMSTRGGFAMQALLLWSPVAGYRGRGFDNLAARSGSLRAQSPNYQDWGHGMALHFDLSLGWNWSIFRVEAGYQRLSFWARNGTRRYYIGDGTTRDRTLERADADVGGAYAGASLRF